MQAHTAHENLFHWADVAGDRRFTSQPTRDGVREHTFAEAADEVRRMARRLSADFARGSHIAILSKNCAEWILADLAIWAAGHVSVPIYPAANARAVRCVLEHARVKAVFVGRVENGEILDGIPDGVERIALRTGPTTISPAWDDIVANARPLVDVQERDANGLATIIYTSGTTGEPKGVMHSFASLDRATRSVLAALRVDQHDRLFSYLPLAHVAERCGVELCGVYSGASIFFADTLDTFAADLSRARPTVFISVPRLWQKLEQRIHDRISPRVLDAALRLPWVGSWIGRRALRILGLDSVRFALCGAAPVSATLLAFYARLGLPILEAYGMTELAGPSHVSRPDDVRIGYVGTALPGVEHAISEEGELLIRSASLTMGYFENETLTRELFTEGGFVCTGDLGEVDDRGRVRITGRIKDIFKTSKGKYVAPAPIEDALAAHPRIASCCVLGEGLAQPCALVVLAEPTGQGRSARSALDAELSAHTQAVNGSLVAHEKLSCIVVIADTWTVSNGLVTPTLKVKRHAIEARYGHLLPAWCDAGRTVVWSEGS